MRPFWHLLLACAGLALFGQGTGRANEPGQNRYNILFIAVDDLRPELGCYGASYAQSPHLDRFAKSAAVFSRHYVQVPTCGASRYALLTGRSPARSGVTSSNTALYQGKPALQADQQLGAQSLPELFRRSGYQTACIGKISHTADGRVFAYNGQGDGRPELPHAWDELPTPFGAWKRGWGIFFAYEGGRHREDGQGNQDLMEFAAQRDEQLPDGLLAQAAIEQLRQYQGSEQPFFLGVGFFKPHLPFVATQEDWDAVDEGPIPLPADDPVDSPYWHRSGEFYRYDFPFAKTRPLSDAAKRQTRRAYLACVRYVDRQVGQVLDALDELGLAENTVVVVWGDHGWHLGEGQIWGKHSPFEHALRSPLMLRVPGMTDAGLKSKALVETLDVYPTLVDLCAPRFRETHAPLDGRSLRPLLTGEKSAVRQAALSYWQDAVSVRTDTHRLVAQVKRGQPQHVELYDLSQDLGSLTNCSAEQPEVVQALLAHLPPVEPASK